MDHKIPGIHKKRLRPYKAFFKYIFSNNFSSEQTKYKNPNESFVIGEAFELYTRSKVFPKSSFSLVEKTHGYNQNKTDFVESSLNPDFKFRDKSTNKEFWIECKFRSYNPSKNFEIISTEQLRRHKSKNEPVYVLIGIGNNPSNPSYLFKIPIHKCYPEMYLSSLFNYALSRPDK